jgi:hypothetical protein
MVKNLLDDGSVGSTITEFDERADGADNVTPKELAELFLRISD